MLWMRGVRYGRVVAVEGAYYRVGVHGRSVVLMKMMIDAAAVVELVLVVHRGRAAHELMLLLLLVARRVLFASRIPAHIDIRVLAAPVAGAAKLHEQLGRVASSRRLLACVATATTTTRVDGLLANTSVAAQRITILVGIRRQQRVRAQVVVGEYVIRAVHIQIAQVDAVVARVRVEIIFSTVVVVVFATAAVAMLARRVDERAHQAEVSGRCVAVVSVAVVVRSAAATVRDGRGVEYTGQIDGIATVQQSGGPIGHASVLGHSATAHAIAIQLLAVHVTVVTAGGCGDLQAVRPCSILYL